MKTVINFLRGTIQVLISGVELERFLNQCAKANLRVWDADWQEPFLLGLTVTKKDLPRLKLVAERVQCALEVTSRRGLPFFLARFRKRYALLGGLLLCILAVAFGSRILLVIDIEGNEHVTTAEILSAMRQHGVKPGIYTPSVNRGILSNNILLTMDELSFFTINFHGIRAEVIVREKIPKPDIVDEKQVMDVVSTGTGIITHMEVLEGDPLVAEGQTVVEGEVLISGLIDVKEPEFATTDLGTSYAHAQGRIYARTWHTMKASIPLTAQVKELTGQEKSRYALNVLGKRVKFYRNGSISFDRYDKITKSKGLALPGGERLPFSLEKETYRAYVTKEAQLSEEAADQMLRERLLAQLEARIDSGEVLKTDFVTRKADGCLEVTLLAECTEQIGKEVPREVTALPEPAAGQEEPVQ